VSTISSRAACGHQCCRSSPAMAAYAEPSAKCGARAAVQRCCVHKRRNLERKVPKHALSQSPDHVHRIGCAPSVDTPRGSYAVFERTWGKRCPGAVTSLREGGDELLSFFGFPKAQWTTLRTTNTIERLHEEVRRRVKTQGSLPAEDAALTLLFSLVASG